MEFLPSRLTLGAILLLGLIVSKLVKNRRKTPNAPGIGYGSLPFLGAWKGAFTFMKDPLKTMNEGCQRYKGGYFKISTHSVEYLMVADKGKIAEYLAAPEDVLNFHDSVADILQVEWTLGYGVAHRPYHIGLIRTKLTQTIAANTPAMSEEVIEGIHSLIGTLPEWTPITVYELMAKVVARVSNNAFTGLEFCRNEEFLDVAIAYAKGVVLSAEILRLFPDWLKPLVALFTPYARVQKKARQLMGPYVQQRLDTNWNTKERPKDMIQFLIDSAPDVERNMHQIVERMMTLNMASIHTTTMTVTTAIISLASRPEYIPELRAEVMENCVDGRFEKDGLLRMSKLDSFLRECGRLEPLGLFGLGRAVRKDFTFSDGMVVPAGSTVATPIMMFHVDESDLTNSKEFDGFRYSRMNKESSGPTRHQMVNTDLNYLLFGHGKHACPGRFLAVAELKLIVASLLLNYDLKIVKGTEPKKFYFGTARVPDVGFQILMKARDASAAN